MRCGFGIILVVCGSLGMRTGDAAAIAYDSAGDAVYNSGWVSRTGGGFGWGGPWQFSVTDGGDFFHIASSTLNGGGDPEGDGDINLPPTPAGRAWALTTGARPGVADAAYASRPLSGSLGMSQSILFDFDNTKPVIDASIAGYGLQSFRFESASPALIDLPVALEATSQSRDYMVRDATGVHDTGLLLTDQGLRGRFTLSGPTNYQISLTPLVAGATPTIYSGTMVDEPINQITAVNQDAGPSLSNALFLNSIAVVPEPGSAMPAAAAVALVLRRRHRRGNQVAGGADNPGH